ncbi:MAG: aldehyde dehydrogenase family protein [Leptospira sp.]|nr:aldehyde dehydrogenase family protein [Leptospira sp.]
MPKSSTNKPTVSEILKTMDYGPAPESNDPANKWLQSKKNKFQLFINNEWVDPLTKKWFPSENPANGSIIGQLAQGGDADIDKAVKASKAAQADWYALGGHNRAKYIYAIARLIQKHARTLSVLETMDNGKSFRETRDLDIPLAARHFYHHAGWAQIMDAEFPDFEPMGVVGQIIPWNFPFLMLAWKVAPALAAGNTVILKPAEQTSLTALLFADLILEAGLPKGVFNLVTGEGPTGAALVAHPEVNKLAFTGSTDIGRKIRVASAGSGKSLTLELGGKSPFIVFEDADLDSAVEGVVDAIWFNQGQVCCGGSRILVQEGVSEKFIKKLKKRMESLRLGDPLDKSTDIGAVIDQNQWNTIAKYVKIGTEEGGSCFQPSWATDTLKSKEGCFYPPTLFTNITPTATIAQEEIFGPVVVAITFRTADEAVEIANNIRFGLAASIWSENINQALDVVPKIKAGVIWVNTTNQFDAACGFGGYKESGFGREGGKEGFYAYIKPKFEKALPLYKVEDTKSLESKTSTPDSSNNEGEEPAGKATTGKQNTESNSSSISIDRTAKLYIGGKQTRPDGEVSQKVLSPKGKLVGLVGEGNRKDIRNAVEAARKAGGWSSATHHNRSQVLYYMAENLSARSEEFAMRIQNLTDCDSKTATKEVEMSISRLFTYAAWADKYDGLVHTAPIRNITIALHEPIGIVGIVCPDELPLLGMISLVAPAIAMGNRTVVVPSEKFPLAATDFYQVLDTSDVPGGAVNIVTGYRKDLVPTLADHLDVDALWYFGPDKEGSKVVEEKSAGNMKRTFCNYGKKRDWLSRIEGEGTEFLRQATQVKNVWVPYGEIASSGTSY